MTEPAPSDYALLLEALQQIISAVKKAMNRQADSLNSHSLTIIRETFRIFQIEFESLVEYKE